MLRRTSRVTARTRSLLKTVLLLLYPRSCLYDHWRGLSTSLPRAVASPSGALTSAERAAVDAVTSHIVPTDHEAGAREVGAVFYIEAAIEAAPELVQRYRKGVSWLDYAAGKCFRQAFLALTRDQQRHILVQLDGRGSSRLEQRRLALFYQDFWMARNFFWTVRRHTFEAFYASPTGQALVGFALPVQQREDVAPASSPLAR
jgi:Gluconate 2-dehydrogenase subunit 3